MQQLRLMFYIVTGMLVMLNYVDALDIKVLPTSSKFAKSQAVEVVLQYSNTGSETLFIHNWYMPQKQINDPIFQVTCNGKPVQYTGKLIKRRAPTINDVTSLAPGKTVQSSVELSSVYDMTESGNYVIEYNMDVDRILFTSASTPLRNDQKSKLQVASTTVFVEGRPSTLPEQNGQASISRRRRRSTFAYCSPSQSSAINTAFTAATSYASGAVNYLKTTTPSGTSRYVTWFGQYSSTNWNTVKTHYTNIHTAMTTKTFTFDCSTCRESDVFAYVYASLPYKIYLCGSFWSAATTGTDSKAGTIVHESSHFTVLAGTQDHAYGKTACQSLAKSSPAQAIMNADSHEYFAENNPVLR